MRMSGKKNKVESGQGQALLSGFTPALSTSPKASTVVVHPIGETKQEGDEKLTFHSKKFTETLMENALKDGLLNSLNGIVVYTLAIVMGMPLLPFVGTMFVVGALLGILYTVSEAYKNTADDPNYFVLDAVEFVGIFIAALPSIGFAKALAGVIVGMAVLAMFGGVLLSAVTPFLPVFVCAAAVVAASMSAIDRVEESRKERAESLHTNRATLFRSSDAHDPEKSSSHDAQEHRDQPSSFEPFEIDSRTMVFN